MKKIILTAAIAAALTLSCAPAEDEGEIDDGGNNKGGNNSSGGGGNGSGTTYKLIESNIDGDGDAYFIYEIPDGDEFCEEGVYSTQTSPYLQFYSIDNKKMTWGLSSDYSIQFNGTSNELIGTWTRTKSKSDCELVEDGDYAFKYCRPNYDVTKAVITETTTDTTIAITRQECPTDYLIDGSSPVEGWKLKVKDCNTVEYTKGSDKITVTRSNDGGEKTTYKGKSCELVVSKAKKTAACKKAWEEEGDEAYMWILYRDYEKCLKDNLPEEFFDDDGGYGYCEDSDGIFDFCDCYDECWCGDYVDGDAEWINWCEEGFAAKTAKPTFSAIKVKPAKIFKAKTSKLKPLLKKRK
ncbi:MAG: hypothetical protein LBC87_04660 [Fibromonadaceae bacterium]|jgi:hypothetical protein|nr:hypothetical protein [Fibromonadaceae bacterium]